MSTTLLDQPTEAEKEAIEAIRAAVNHKIEKEGWTREQLAEMLDLLPWGVKVLFKRSWTLENACRVAHILGVPVEVRVGG